MLGAKKSKAISLIKMEYYYSKILSNNINNW